MMRRRTIVFVVICGMLFAAALAVANQDRGAAEIILDGGTSGNVPFPHWKHQDNLKDCNVCHDVFPQSEGAIEALKTEGKLKRKHVMNKLCTKCHKAKKKAGLESGPVTCKSCHIKEG